VAWYRFTLRSGIRKICFRRKKFSVKGDYFYGCSVHDKFPDEWKPKLLDDADQILDGRIRYYAFHWKYVGTPPDWFLNPFNKSAYPDTDSHWTKLPDFDPVAGDIKNIWEASRFEWAVTLARAFRISGKSEYMETLNAWLKDWVKSNPLNTGPNWKCGQEASIRVFNLINATLILNQSGSTSKALTDLINDHLQRIYGNIRYAISQDNNHGTSEAAALFIGGNWLNIIKPEYPKAKKYAVTGRKWLENRLKKLVEEDGSFSQHSVTYHRVLLDTLIFVEFWRQKFETQEFSDGFYRKVRATIEWLWHLTDELSGNCPNLGANDGALFINMHSCNFRDFRPTLQTACVIFKNTKYYNIGLWDEPLYWFERNSEPLPVIADKKESKVLPGGYVILQSSGSWALVRFPHFRFRPSHNDVFHIDLWHNGINILCDSGTFSYNSATENVSYDFTSVKVHNTLSFDCQEQMPRLSRFLLGTWIVPDAIGQMKIIDKSQSEWYGKYTDYRGNTHKRSICCMNNNWTIEDSLSGKFRTADIGFNLSDTCINVKDNIITTIWGQIITDPGVEFKIEDVFVSDYYMEKHLSKRLKIHLTDQKNIVTIIKLYE
jgi:hypothetical protein